MKKYVILLILCCFSVYLFGQIDVVDKYFTKWIKADVPGCALGIVKDGELIFAKGYGLADLEHDIEITQSSAFFIASITKQFVAFSVLLLEE